MNHFHEHIQISIEDCSFLFVDESQGIGIVSIKIKSLSWVSVVQNIYILHFGNQVDALFKI